MIKMQYTEKEGNPTLVSGMSSNPKKTNVKVVDMIDLTHIDEDMDKNATSEHSVKLKCVVCKETFTDSTELHKHATLIHSEVKIFFCDLCTESFLCEKDMQEHKKTIHRVVLENNDYLLVQQEEVKKQNVNGTLVKKNLNVHQKRRRRRKAHLKSYIAMNRIQMKTRSRKKNSNNLKSILAKHGCLKNVTIPLTRIDHHPLVQQKMNSNKESNSSQIIVKKTYKMDDEEDVFLVKVKKCNNRGNVFTITRVRPAMDVKDTSGGSQNMIDACVLRELLSKLQDKIATSTAGNIDYNKNGTFSEIKTRVPPATNDKQEIGKDFNKTEEDFSKIRLQNIQKNINILQKKTAKEKGNSSDMPQSQNREKLNANTLKNIEPSQDSVSHAQRPNDAPQDCCFATQNSKKKKSFITSIEVFKPDVTTRINTQDVTKHISNASGYVPVLRQVVQNPNIKQNTLQTLGNTPIQPVHCLSEQPSIYNNQLSWKMCQAMPVKNVTLLKKQDGSFISVEEASSMSTLNLVKQIKSNILSPLLKEVAIQTNPENDKMYTLVMDYLMSAMKLLNPVLMINGKSVSLSEYQKKNDTEGFVELAEKPSENQIVNQVIGMCCSCRSVASLLKHVMFAKQSIGTSKCPLCVERYATVVGVRQHLKKAHLPCAIMTGKKNLSVKILDTAETLYVSKSNNFISECFCCKTKFSEIKEFIKHIRLLHYQSFMNTILQSEEETSVHEEDYFITTDKHFENYKYRAKDKVVSVTSEKSVKTAVNLNVKEKGEGSTSCADYATKTTKDSAVHNTAKPSSLKRSRSVEEPNLIEKEIATKSNNSASYPASEGEIKTQNKKLKPWVVTKKSKREHLCLKCFTTFETNNDLLKHIETHLADSSGKSNVNAQKHSSSSTPKKKDSPCPAKNTDESKQNISPTTEEGSKLTEADSTVLINSAHACRSNSGNGEEKKNSTAIKLVCQNRDNMKSLINVKSETGIDQNYCSSTSNANVDSISDESIGSMDSSDTLNSAKTIVMSGTTCISCNKTFDGEKGLNDHMYFVHDVALGEEVIADTLEPKFSETQENAAKEEKNENKNETTKQGNVSTKKGKMTIIKRDLRCSPCEESFHRKEDLIIHRYEKHNDESAIHVCDNCSMVLFLYSDVNMHVCNDVDAWKCRRCNLDFSNGSALRLHNVQKHLETEGSRKCPLCNKKFLTTSMLERHISHIHKSNKSKNIMRMLEKTNSTSTSELNNAVSSSVHCSTPNNPSTSTGGSQNNDATTQQNNSNNSTVTKPVAWQCIDKDSACKLFDGDVYTCGVCKIESNSKPGLKLHLKKQHRINAEECQLCTHLFERDCLGKHLIRDHVIPKYSKEENVGGHGVDGETFLKLLSPERLLTCCQYQKYVDHSYHGVMEAMRCTRCAKNFLNGRFHRIHFLWMHDTTCLLCNEDFDKSSTAVGHKIRVHNSIGTYMWAVEKILKTLLDLNIFGQTIDDMINKLENKQDFFGSGDSNKKMEDLSRKDNVTKEAAQETPVKEVKGDCKLSPTIKTDTAEVSEEITARNNAVHDSGDDEKRFVLVITQNDIERHKNDIKTLAKNLCANSNIFSQDYIEKLLESYVKSKMI